MDLKQDYAQDTLKNLYKIWKRPTNLETVVDERAVIMHFDGSEHSTKVL